MLLKPILPKPHLRQLPIEKILGINAIIFDKK